MHLMNIHVFCKYYYIIMYIDKSPAAQFYFNLAGLLSWEDWLTVGDTASLTHTRLFEIFRQINLVSILPHFIHYNIELILPILIL